jgi:two-component system sensor histidine kinase KdpD
MDAQAAPSSFRRWGTVAALLVLATALSRVLEPHVSLTSQAMIYVLAVVIAAYRLDWVPSVVCAVGAVTALNFFFVPPRWTFAVESREHLISLAVMLVVALVISRLASGLRRETDIARLNEVRARQLQALASELVAAPTPQDVRQLGQAALDAAFSGTSQLVLASDEGEPEPFAALEPAVRDGLRACMKERAVLGPGTGRWPGLAAWYLPLGDQGEVFGAACVRPAPAADDGGREHAQALCALLAQALGRLRLSRSMQAAQSEVERQQLQNTFLAAISHDLRTPLAAIVAAATSLQMQRERLDAAAQARLLQSIVNEADYLGTMSDNTLQLLRLASPGQVLQRSWESVEEIVGAVLGRVRQHDPARRIRSRVPEGLPLVRADAVLLAQLLANLLDNALQYSEDEVELSVETRAGTLELCVKDRGPGIPEAEREAIFQPYVRGDRAGRRGTGLGLAVCRAIARAHGAQLLLRAREGGGSCFCLQLPVEAQPASPEPSR